MTSPDILLLRSACSSKSARTSKLGSQRTPKTSPSCTATYVLSVRSTAGRKGSHDAPLRLHPNLAGLVQFSPGSVGALSESSRSPRERHVSFPAPLSPVLRQSAAERSALRRCAAPHVGYRFGAARSGERRVHAVPRSRAVSTFPRRSTTKTSSSTPAS